MVKALLESHVEWRGNVAGTFGSVGVRSEDTFHLPVSQKHAIITLNLTCNVEC